MLDTKMYAGQPLFVQSTLDTAGQARQATKEALYSYRAALLRGTLGRLWARLSGRSRDLLDLNVVAAGTRIGDRHHAGVRAVPIKAITGSLGRSGDFDSSFNPLSEETRDRWLSVARARHLGVALPPVEMIQLGERYFVRDGHHRISVARSLGEEAVDAEVTVWEVA